MRCTALLAGAVVLSCSKQPVYDPPPEPVPSTAEAAPARDAADAPVPATADDATPDAPAPPTDAIVEKSGLASKVLRAGTGGYRPGPSDMVEVNFTVRTADGQVVDSSTARGSSAKWSVGNSMPGLSQGIQLMSIGEERRFWIPAALQKSRSGTAAGTLVFDVELLSVERYPQVIPPPPDVAAPPRNARREPGGLASLVLVKGTGKRRPTAADRVVVHYSGWTTDGRLFDSSIPRGRPARFALRGVIPGWAEGVQLMVEGEKRRLWIPAELAYDGRPGAPAGMLVFDVELIAIQ
jgi:peptidylprolyl isomerase